jgi:hypothetical protein
MIAAALALVALGLVFLFVMPWVGVPVGIVGLILFVLYLAGIGRRAVTKGSAR